MNYKM